MISPVTIETDRQDVVLPKNPRTAMEWFPYIGKQVRQEDPGRAVGGVIVRLVGVHGTMAEICPPGHKKHEHVPIKYLVPFDKGIEQDRQVKLARFHKQWILRDERNPGHFLCKLPNGNHAVIASTPEDARCFSDKNQALAERRDIYAKQAGHRTRAPTGLNPCPLPVAIADELTRRVNLKAPAYSHAPSRELRVDTPPAPEGYTHTTPEAIPSPVVTPEPVQVPQETTKTPLPVTDRLAEALQMTKDIAGQCQTCVPAIQAAPFRSAGEGESITMTNGVAISPLRDRALSVLDGLVTALREEAAAVEMAACARIKRKLAERMVAVETLRKEWHL